MSKFKEIIIMMTMVITIIIIIILLHIRFRDSTGFMGIFVLKFCVFFLGHQFVQVEINLCGNRNAKSAYHCVL